MGYHLKQIKKGKFGEFSKIEEEFYEAEANGSQTCHTFWIVSMMEIPESVYNDNKDKYEN